MNFASLRARVNTGELILLYFRVELGAGGGLVG